ncbi:hypothetical protein POM88_017213 [Heracleum sosnowskyi]|uniref:Uncharacterized protein n=1 Tax=Heracleum sosnowskyi TaxID=360622 RepID=A0AAD8IS52_9APIA|nr:hypothetical protein POM88_017213 [Heracleum sosnowskyi]
MTKLDKAIFSARLRGFEFNLKAHVNIDFENDLIGVGKDATKWGSWPKTTHISTGEKIYVPDAAARCKPAGQDTVSWLVQNMEVEVPGIGLPRDQCFWDGYCSLCYKAGDVADIVGLTGHERYNIDLPNNLSDIRPGQDVTVIPDSGKSFTCTVRFGT